MKTLIRIQRIFLILSLFTLTSCSSLSWMKFWGDEDEEEGPAELYSVNENRNLEREWSVSNGNENLYGRLIPSVYDGQVFYINSSGYVSSVDLETGKLKWSKNTQDTVSTGLDVNFKTISYGTLNGELVTLKSQNGEEIWRSPTSSESLSPPVNSGSHMILHPVHGRHSLRSLVRSHNLHLL